MTARLSVFCTSQAWSLFLPLHGSSPSSCSFLGPLPRKSKVPAQPLTVSIFIYQSEIAWDKVTKYHLGQCGDSLVSGATKSGGTSIRIRIQAALGQQTTLYSTEHRYLLFLSRKGPLMIDLIVFTEYSLKRHRNGESLRIYL